MLQYLVGIKEKESDIRIPVVAWIRESKGKKDRNREIIRGDFYQQKRYAAEHYESLSVILDVRA